MASINKVLSLFFRSFFIFLFTIPTVVACPFCASERGQAIRQQILEGPFLFFISSVIACFIIFYATVLIIAKFVVYMSNKQGNYSIQQPIAAMLLGGGVAAFLDCIIFHQIFQTHNLVSNFLPLSTVIEVEINMFWDGIFELFALLTVIAGIGLLRRASENSIITLSHRAFVGWNLIGLGLFNFIEGLLNHQIFQLHHVVQRDVYWQANSDALFLFIAIIMILIGMILIKNSLYTINKFEASAERRDNRKEK